MKSLEEISIIILDEYQVNVNQLSSNKLVSCWIPVNWTLCFIILFLFVFVDEIISVTPPRAQPKPCSTTVKATGRHKAPRRSRPQGARGAR